jgi:transposase
MDPIRVFPYGPAASVKPQDEAGHTSAPDHVDRFHEDSSCINGGVHTRSLMLVSKYADHLPLYRQAQIYSRQGIDLDRSTLADWVGRAQSECLPFAINAHERFSRRSRADCSRS